VKLVDLEVDEGERWGEWLKGRAFDFWWKNGWSWFDRRDGEYPENTVNCNKKDASLT
jgi:hypothetical protein